MKKAILFLLLSSVAFIVKGQDQKWNKFYEQIYGSQSEYQDQVALRNSRTYDFYRLIGFKSYYTNGPSGFLQQEKNLTMDARESHNKMIYTLTGKNVNGKKQKCHLIFRLNKDDRIQKAKITGSPDIIKFLFMSYWPAESSIVLKEGEIKEKRMPGEKVVFNYTGKKPFIEITGRRNK